MSVRLPVLGAAPLEDGLARRVSYVRVSLTDRCNYRCTYCMPEEGVELLPQPELLTFEELERLVTMLARLGVRRVRLTGGEPTIRRDVTALVARLARVPGLDEVVMTTNGHRLAELAAALAAAGLAGLNVSVDTLDAERFARITRRGDLARVLAGIEAARAAGLPLKLNVVALAGFNDDELGALCDYAWARGIVPRFIEWMPMSGGALYAPGAFLAADEVRRRIALHTGVASRPVVSAAGVGVDVGPARYHEVPGRGRFGVISAISEQFCDTCNRVRLTAVGALHTCLADDQATDLRHLLRGGADDAMIEAAVRGALAGKQRGHDFTREGCGAPAKHMVSIGG